MLNVPFNKKLYFPENNIILYKILSLELLIIYNMHTPNVVEFKFSNFSVNLTRV